MRTSSKRNIILETVRANPIHGTAEQIYELVHKKDNRISLATVYRNLKMFSENGDILRLSGIGEYDRFDGCTEPHAHFVCKSCGKIFDIMYKNSESSEVSALKMIPDGFSADSVQTVIYGTCCECGEKDKSIGAENS